MKILFRTDASALIGSGHAMRCLALAQACRAGKIEALFAMVSDLPAVSSRLADEGINVVRLDLEIGGDEDARQTAVLARDCGALWVVLDGYAFGADFQRRLKEAGLHVLVIDDYGHAASYCADIVLNQNVYADESLYPRRESSTRLLLGSRFVVLRDEFSQWLDWVRPTPEFARNILVTFGGADPVHATAKAVEALRELPGDFEAVIVSRLAGPFVKHDDSRLRVESDVRAIAERMAWADLAITASGTTCWELAFMQVPQIVVPIADNQRAVAAGIAARGAALNLGWHAQVTPGDIRGKTADLMTDKERRGRMSAAGRAVVDGRGAARVVTHLKSKSLSLRTVGERDRQLLWDWANAPEVRAVSFSSDPIPWEDHCRWFSSKLTDPRCVLYIAQNEAGEPVGQVRFDLDGAHAVISTSIDRRFRGEGCGSASILLAAQTLIRNSAVEAIHAYIKPGNEPSLRAFARAGFGPVVNGDGNAHLVWKRDTQPAYEAA